MNKFVLLSGAVLCLSGVVIGAFGAHALSELLQENDRVSIFELANRYQFYHGLALLLIGGLSNSLELSIKWVAVSMLTGVLVFSGSLYTLSLFNASWLGAITPIGGVLLLVSWSLFANTLWRLKV